MKEIYHGILLRDTLVLSCLLIKALICLAEGKEAGLCGDIIAKLKAMPSGSWASTMVYLQEHPGSVPHCIYLFKFEFFSHETDDDGENWGQHFCKGRYITRARRAHSSPKLFGLRMEEQIGTPRLAFETTWRWAPFGRRHNRTESSVKAATHQDGCGRGSFSSGSMHF